MTNTITVLKNNILAQMIHQVEDLAEESPSQALGLLQVAESAAELKRARKALNRVNRQNHHNATVRYQNENSHGRSGLEARLMANPAQALADAESTPQGRRHLCEMWESLGRVLLEKPGMNDQEHKMACIMLGAPDVQLRSSKVRLDFERALAEDRDRKFEVIDERVEKYMGVFLGRMGDQMMVNFVKEGDREAAMFATFLTRYKDWVEYLHFQLQEESEFYYAWKNRPPTGRPYWASTRKFIAQQLLKYRAMGQKNPELMDASKPVIVLNMQELKAAETAQRSVNQALSAYQKSVAAAKTMGLFVVEKPRKKAVVESSEVDSGH